MVQTFDTSRVGGGTYELELDSTGNYKLKSVGFEAVDKLNLPDLKTSDTSVADTTKKATEDTIKAQTTEVFKPMNTYGDRGGESLAERQGFQDYDRVVPQTEKPNELNQYQSRPDITGMTFTGATGKETYKTPRTISDQNKYYGRTFTTPETGLQKVSSKIKTGIENSMIVNAAKALTGVFQGVVDSFVGPEQTALNNANKNALNSLGYKTNYELGNSLDPGRIAGNPVENVFAGMNAVSKYGDISRGAANKIATIENTISKMTPQQLANSKLPARLELFKEQKKEFDQAKGTDKTTSTPTVTVNTTKKSKDQTSKRPNMADVSGPTKKTSAKTSANNTPSSRPTMADVSGPTKKDYAAPGTLSDPKEKDDSGSNGGGRVICTDLHRTGELSTRDWIRDTKFTFKTLSITHVKGYLLWAEPTVRHIQKYPRYRKVWKHIAQHRANDIAWRLNEGKFDLLGRIYAGIGEPVCWALGNFVSDKQISKYNLTHWRRA
jgi:hypothetical protein